MPDNLVVETMRQFAAGILAREQLQTAQLIRAWMHVEDKLQADIDALAVDLATEKAAGRAISQAKLFRMARYQELLRQLHTEVSQYTAATADSITARQLELAGLGIDQAAQAIELSSPTIHASFNRLPVSAVHNMVGLAGDGSPLRTLLAASYPDAVEGITGALIRGTALGWHPTRTARAMRQGSEMGLQRSLTIARTEQLRTLRTASQAQYVASGVVNGLMWLCANSSRTCLACLAKSGKLIPLNEPFFDHVNGRCTAVPILINRPLPTFQTGQQWFEQQDETVQREMMGPGKFAAWKDGAFKFEDLAKITSDPTWGKSLGMRPLGELGGGRGSVTATVEPVKVRRPIALGLSDYQPAKTIKVAEKWAADHGVQAEYGRDLQGANWINEALSRLHAADRTLPPHVRIASEPFIKDFGERGSLGAQAMYDHEERCIYYNPRAPMNKSWREAASDAERANLNLGEFSSNDRHGTFFHEYGHMLHNEVDDPVAHRRRGMSEISPFTREERAAIHPELRARYAFTNGNEFVAEVIAGRLTGHEYSETVMSVYRKYGGPTL